MVICETTDHNVASPPAPIAEQLAAFFAHPAIHFADPFGAADFESVMQFRQPVIGPLTTDRDVPFAVPDEMREKKGGEADCPAFNDCLSLLGSLDALGA